MTKSNGTTDYVTGPAEYRCGQDRTWARVNFLRAIEEYTPQVLEDLRNRVLPAYRPLHAESAQTLQEIEFDPSQRDQIMERIGYVSRDQIMERIGGHVERWADEFNLRGPKPSDPRGREAGRSLFDWMADVVVCTLIAWQDNPERPPTWAGLPEHSVVAGWESPGQFKFEIDGWAVQRESEEAFRKRLLGQFENQLREYIENRRIEGEGLVPVASRTAISHFAYLALFQCSRLSHEQIKTRFDKSSRSSVGDGIRRAAEGVIGESYEVWLMPPSPPGRRRADDDEK